MTSAVWSQASLPLRWGGIGVCSAHRLAPSAFLASAAGATELLSLLLPVRVLETPDPAVCRALQYVEGYGGDVAPYGPDAMVQRNWDEVTCRVAAGRLREGADERTIARLLASCAPESGVNAIPSASLGLDFALRIGRS